MIQSLGWNLPQQFAQAAAVLLQEPSGSGWVSSLLTIVSPRTATQRLLITRESSASMDF